MLVLSRKRNEQLVIGGDIVITVIDVRGDKVRLGIEAPSSIPVHREEVLVAIQKEPHGCEKPPVGGRADL
jgi:carbon storage regulator